MKQTCVKRNKNNIPELSNIIVNCSTRVTATWKMITISGWRVIETQLCHGQSVRHRVSPAISSVIYRSRRHGSHCSSVARRNVVLLRTLNDDVYLSDRKRIMQFQLPSAICIDSSFACNLLHSYYASFPRYSSHPSITSSFNEICFINNCSRFFLLAKIIV